MATLQIRLQDEDKKAIQAAARARKVSLSDYTRRQLLDAATRDLRADEYSLSLNPTEQEAMWQLLSAPTVLTSSQRQLRTLANEWL